MPGFSMNEITLFAGAWNHGKMTHELKARNPLRWSGEIRNWDNPKEIWLNPERGINVATDRKSETT